MTNTLQTIPLDFPQTWACDWGEDRYGLWTAFQINGIRQAMRWIPPGSFIMGSPEGEPMRNVNEIAHPVEITEGFWLADTCCTQELWSEVMGNNPSSFKDKDLPVERITWYDAQSFLKNINRHKPYLDLCLPSEAQWEYACRSGTVTPFSFGEQITTDLVNYDGNYPYKGGSEGNYREKTSPVKAFPANNWGLFQMHGNVSEWCYDWYGDYPAEGQENPVGPDTGSLRVRRGGCWSSDARRVRSACRAWFAPVGHYDVIGFRFARGQ